MSGEPITTYPAQIAVFCDRCGTEVEHDYEVHDQMTPAERIGVARAHLDSNESWSCTAAGDFCPACVAAGAARVRAGSGDGGNQHEESRWRG